MSSAGSAPSRAWPDTTPELAVGFRRTGSAARRRRPRPRGRRGLQDLYVPRRTHLVTPEEGGIYLALRASGRQWELPSWQEAYGLAPADWPAFRETVREAVAESPLTRQELASAVGRRRRFRAAAAGLTSGSDTLLKSLMWQGDLCFGPARDGESTVQGLHRVARWAGLPDVDEAGRRAVEATSAPTARRPPMRVHYYLGAGLSAGRKALRGWLDDLSGPPGHVAIDGEDLFVLADDVDELTSTPVSPTVRLLPAADPWVMGPGTADPHVVPPAHRQLVTRGANLVLAGGVVAGTWTRKASDPHRHLARRGRPARSRPARGRGRASGGDPRHRARPGRSRRLAREAAPRRGRA